jgi:transposase
VSTSSNSSAAPPATLYDAEILIQQLQQKLELTEGKLQFTELRVLQLEEQLRLQRIQKYGAGSEKLSNLQLQLLEREPGVSNVEVQAESERPVLEGDASEVLVRQHKRRKHPGRQTLSPELPRVERVIPCPAEECVCGRCGQPTSVIGYEVSEQLDVVPAKYFVLVTKREKRACSCGKGGVITAPAPVRIIDKGLVSDRVVVDTVISKYCDHLPLYRQSLMLERETGLDLSRGTLDGWVMQVGQLLLPVVQVMRNELLGGNYIQADETPVEVQMHDGRGRNHQAYLWQYSQPGGAVIFDFRLGRGRDGPKQFLGSYGGILQTDGYQVYDHVGGPGIIHAACWAHVRRGFYDVMKLNPGDPVALPIVKKINDLFAIDAMAGEQGLSLEARHALRQEKAPEVLNAIRVLIESARAGALPGGALGKACQYTLGLWPKLTRFLNHPELELSNNLAENSMRPVAVGRKNWIHVGSPQAGPKVAAILSVIETCRRLKIAVRDYLSAVLPGLADTPIQRLPELTPMAWAAARRQ